MTTFARRIRPTVQAELDAAAVADARQHFDTAFEHLERAHVLGQPATREHVRVHWHMLRSALRRGLPGEAWGQAWRLVAAAIFTPVGLVPSGNTGGSNVSGLQRMPIPQDLQAALDAASTRQANAIPSWRRLSATFTLSALAALGLAGCGSMPKDLDVSLEKPTAAGVYRVALVPPTQAPAINQMHSWKVKLAAPDGSPVHGARFTVDGGMPQHGHGLPTQPRVTREVADGTYQLDGMKFSMTGWWEVKLGIDGPQGADKVTFNTVIGNPAGRP